MPHSPKPDPPMPTAAEVDILAALWRLGPATVREVHDALSKDCGYNTTLKQMQLMTDKTLQSVISLNVVFNDMSMQICDLFTYFQ